MHFSRFFWLSQLLRLHFKSCRGSTMKRGCVGPAGCGNTILRVCLGDNSDIVLLLMPLLSLITVARKIPASLNCEIIRLSAWCRCAGSSLSTGRMWTTFLCADRRDWIMNVCAVFAPSIEFEAAPVRDSTFYWMYCWIWISSIMRVMFLPCGSSRPTLLFV